MMTRCMIVSMFAIFAFCGRSAGMVTTTRSTADIISGEINKGRNRSQPRNQSVTLVGDAPAFVAGNSGWRDGMEDSAGTQASSSDSQSLQSIISSSCSGTQPGVASLATNASYAVSATVTIPSNCTLRGNGATITATPDLIGDLIAARSAHNIYIIGPLTLNSAQANLRTGKQSRTVKFGDVWHGSVSDVNFTGSTHGELSLFGISDFELRNLTFSKASSAHGATSPAIAIFNWIDGDPTTTSRDVTLDAVKCVGSPTTMPGCILSDGNYNHTGKPGQHNERISITNMSVESSVDDGVEYDHTSGVINEIHCGPGPFVNQCVFLRQTSGVKVDNVTCLPGEGVCVDVARVGDDDATDDIKVSHVKGTGTAGGKDTAIVRVFNASPKAPLTNVTVDGVEADRSSAVGVMCLGPGQTGALLQHISFSNIVTHDNKDDGITIAFCQDVTITNAQSFNNNQAATPCSSFPRTALRIAHSTGVVANGVRGYDDQGQKTQCYGLTVDAGSRSVSINGAEFRDDMNASGGVLNQAGDAHIVYRKNATGMATIGGQR